jgi:hypothetical protein
MKNEYVKTVWLALIAIAGFFALTTQFFFYLNRPSVSDIENIIRYFSYFTIQSNILVTVCTLSLLIKPHSKWGIFFSSAPVFTALTVYIIVVSLVYNLLLRSLYHLEGLEKFANNLLHVVIPVLFVAYWIIYLPKKQLKWNVLPWLIYPLCYAVYILIRGAFSGYYPYPFLNVIKIGYPNVLLSMLFLLLLFLSLSLILVAAAKLMHKRDTLNKITS